MIFRQLNPEGHCKTYLIADPVTREAVIVDPIYNRVDHYAQYLEQEGYQLQATIDTHTHADHITGSPALNARLGVPFLMNEASSLDCARRTLRDGSTLRVGEVELRFLTTPGHTADSLSILVDGNLLTGDALFIGSAGRTDLPGGDAGAHYDSLQKLTALPGETAVWPAHDYHAVASSTLSQQKLTNERLQPRRTRQEYVAYMESLRAAPPEWMAGVLQSNYNCGANADSVYIPEDMNACEVQGGTIGDPVPVLEITPEELLHWQGQQVPLEIIDVRQPEEYRGPFGHIVGAELVPLPVLAQYAGAIKTKGLGKRVITVCHSGARSYSAAAMLTKAGVAEVYSLRGGMLAWNKAGKGR